MSDADKRTKTNRKPDIGWCWGLVAFSVIFMISMLYAAQANVSEYHYDSKYYWNLTNIIFDTGNKPFYPVYILKYPKSIRGYFFPVLTGFFRYIFQGIRGWQILASFSMACCFSLSLPYAIKKEPIRSFCSFVRTMFAFGFYIWVWGNLMQYPLSDFFAAFFLISSIAFLRGIKQSQNILLPILLGFPAGLFLYAGYNTRPTFLYAGLIVIMTFIFINRKNLQTLAISLISILLGISVLASPQCYINNRHEGVFSPIVFYDLADSEVYRGLYTARYETYIGSLDQYPSGGVIFRDKTGEEIIRREGLSIDTFKITDVISLFWKYPFEITGIYFRHFISLMTPVYRQVYLTDVYQTDILCIITGIIIWLMAGLGFLTHIKIHGLNANVFWIIAVCIPGFLQIFDEPELRFFLPIYLLCYYYIFAVIDYKELSRVIQSNWALILIITLIIFAFWISLTGDILSENRDRPLLLSSNDFYTLFIER